MNVANVIPLSAPHAVPYAKSGHPAALNPVRVRFDAFELDEAECPPAAQWKGRHSRAEAIRGALRTGAHAPAPW